MVGQQRSVSPNQQLSRYLVFGGLHQNQKITGRETMGTQHWFPGQIEGSFFATGRVCLFFPGTSLPDSSWEPAPQRWKATLWAMAMSASTSSKGLDNGSNGSTNSPYFIVICPQPSCTEGQEGELRLKTKDRTAQLTILSLHTQYNLYGSLYLTPGTVPNCNRKTEIYVMGTKNTTNLRAGLEPATYFAG